MIDLSEERKYGTQHATFQVETLNELLDKLDIHLPFALETLFDLTPGLLLGILESILQSRLPIPTSVRASRDFSNKVQAMKIFLGVFDNDILGGQDVGLSDIDPRRLAAGDEREVEFIGELLCWLGRKRGILAGPSLCEDELPPSLPPSLPTRPVSPSTHSTVTSAAHSNLSMIPAFLAKSDTTVTSISMSSEPLAPLVDPELHQPSFAPTPSLHRSGLQNTRPQCIHEIPDPSIGLDDVDATVDADVSHETLNCHCSGSDEDVDDLPPTPKTPLPFRYGGWIGVAAEDAQLESYYQRRTPSSVPSSNSRRAKSYPGLSVSHPRPHIRSAERETQRIITPHNAPMAYTLALLKERARLLDELAKIKSTTVAEEDGFAV